MAYDGSYTVLMVPLQNSLYSLDALQCFHLLKRLKDLEKESDALWAGLQEHLWYQNRLQQVYFSSGDLEGKKRWSCALRSCMQRVNGSLGSLITDGCLWSILSPGERGGSDWDLRWRNATLVKQVNQKSQDISLLELERTQHLQQLGKSGS